MKKILSMIVAALSLVMAFAACDAKTTSSGDAQTKEITSEISTSSTEEKQTEAATTVGTTMPDKTSETIDEITEPYIEQIEYDQADLVELPYDIPRAVLDLYNMICEMNRFSVIHQNYVSDDGKTYVQHINLVGVNTAKSYDRQEINYDGDEVMGDTLYLYSDIERIYSDYFSDNAEDLKLFDRTKIVADGVEYFYILPKGYYQYNHFILQSYDYDEVGGTISMKLSLVGFATDVDSNGIYEVTASNHGIIGAADTTNGIYGYRYYIPKETIESLEQIEYKFVLEDGLYKIKSIKAV